MLTFPFPAGPRGTVPTEFAELRETDPVAEVELPDGTRIRLVTRYADVVAVLTDPRFSRARAAALPGTGFGRCQSTGVLDLDPPEHAHLREPLDRALGEDQVRAWGPRLTRAVDDAISAFAALPRPADFVAGFAAPLAARTTCELVGFDVSAAERLAGWVEDVVGGDADAAHTARQELDAALAELVADRRRSPGDDLASALVAPAEPSRGLPDDEAALVVSGLLVSAHIGNRNALSRHAFALLGTPGSFERMRADPATAVEELLRRYPSGNDGLLRVAAEDVELSGTRLEAGQLVMPLVAAACQDPAVFDAPQHLDLGRRPNPHVSFGAGAHACPGAAFVRALFTTTFGSLVAAFPDLRLAVPVDEVVHTADLLPLGVRSLPVEW